MIIASVRMVKKGTEIDHMQLAEPFSKLAGWGRKHGKEDLEEVDDALPALAKDARIEHSSMGTGVNAPRLITGRLSAFHSAIQEIMTPRLKDHAISKAESDEVFRSIESMYHRSIKAPYERSMEAMWSLVSYG